MCFLWIIKKNRGWGWRWLDYGCKLNENNKIKNNKLLLGKIY